jgi:hypothetical protein
LIAELEATRWTGRPGYPIRTMVGLALAKSLYALPTWTKVTACSPSIGSSSESLAAKR